MAKLIKQCESTNLVKDQPARYNHKGNINITTTDTAFKIKTEFTLFNKKEAKRPKVLSQEISIANGLYGIKLNDAYEMVVETFGAPNVQLSLLKGEFIVGYGRNHWLHFQSNRLVKIQSNNDFLVQSTLNKIPFLKFFDDKKWKISNHIVADMSLNDIELKENLNHKNQMISTENGKTMILQFDYVEGLTSQQKSYRLKSFTLQNDSYKRADMGSLDLQQQQFQTIALAYAKLEQNEYFDSKSLQKALGRTIGRITLSKNSVLDIYNPNLQLTLVDKDVSSIHLTEHAFISNKSMPNNWYLANLSNGDSLKEVKEYLPDDIFELQNKIEYLNDDYTLYLFFDENDNHSYLYEAEIKLWL